MGEDSGWSYAFEFVEGMEASWKLFMLYNNSF
jgi:hypothetical protein